jgi:hypothetical protein
MPQISRNSHKVKEIVCDITTDLLTAKIGDKIEIKLKDETMVFQRIQ